jgi:SagB-type dehydrogenase family enzyme
MGRWVLAVLVLVLTGCSAPASVPVVEPEEGLRGSIVLPAPRLVGTVSLEESLSLRRSVRDYSGEPLALEDLAQLLWAAQGKTADWGGRTAPSAGGLYPLELSVAVGEVVGLEPGVYRYAPDGHRLVTVASGDVRTQLSEAALGQSSVRQGAVVLAISAVYRRVTEKYGERGVMYAHMEAGHAAQNVYLQAAALNLGTVTVGAFNDEEVSKILGLAAEEQPLYLMPVGAPA